MSVVPGGKTDETVPRRLTPTVVFFAAFYPPFTGGYAKSVQALTERIARRGWRVLVITTWTDGGAAVATEQGVEVIRLPAWNVLGTYPIPKPSGLFICTIWQLLRTKLTIISTQTRFFPTSFLGMLVGWLKRTPIVHTERGSVHTASDKRHIRSVNLVVDHTLGSLLVRSARVCVGVSEAAAWFCHHLGARSTTVIPNGIVTATYGRPLTQAMGSTIRIVYVGRLIWAKGVQDLIEAFAVVQRSGQPISLVIAGAGVFENELRALCVGRGVAEAVQFLGEKLPAEIPAVLAATDIFVNPSYSEGLPSSVLEAAATGCAVIATDVGGTREIIRDGETGLLIPPRDRTALVAALESLIREPALRERLGVRARNAVATRFDWGAISDAYLRTFQEAARR